MERDGFRAIHGNKKKKNISGIVASVLSVASALGIGKLTLDIRSSQMEVLKPSTETIRNICKELVIEERDRAKEKERELKDYLDILSRDIYRRGR